MLRATIVTLSLILFLQCTTEDGSMPELNVMFMGNSLTYENDLPLIVSNIAAMDGVKLRYITYAAPNYSFDDHLADGIIHDGLSKSKYDFLVGQQGPSALPESQALLKASSMRIAEECRAASTTFALYMVWPSLARDFDRENCIASYTNAARSSNALLCPAGLAWKLAWQKDPALPLYGPDNFHPGIHGSFLAAMVIYASIRQKNNLDFVVRPATIPEEHFMIMKEAALASLTNP